MSSTNKELRHRCHCPKCGKVFDNRQEGFVFNGYLICADCYHSLSYKTGYSIQPKTKHR